MNVETPNIDQAEVQKFSKLAEQWWDPEGKFRPLHMLNPLRLDFIKQHSAISGRKVIDVGCGGGILAESLAMESASVTGLDVSEASLQVAKIHLHESELAVNYIYSTIEDFVQQGKEQFDILTCMEMLEHVPDPASTIEACAQVVKSGGSLYFSTLNRTVKSWLFGIVGAEYILNLLPRGTHQHKNFIKPSELNHWCRQAGITIQSIVGMHYNPLNQTFRLAPGVDVNYIVHCVRS